MLQFAGPAIMWSMALIDKLIEPFAFVGGRLNRRPGPTLRAAGLDYGWRAFRNRSESETHPRIPSAVNRGVVIAARQSMPDRFAHAVC